VLREAKNIPKILNMKSTNTEEYLHWE